MVPSARRGPRPGPNYRPPRDEVNPSFWKGRKVLVTGHTGFKGAWLGLWLERLGARVTGLALPPEEPALFTSIDLASRIDSRIGDVRDDEAIRRALDVSEAEIVFHLAAQSLVHEGYREPVETYSTNVLGTVQLLEAVRRADSVSAVVVVTTDKCYENREWPWGYRESDRLGGKDPYSSSKACAELVTAAYRSSYFGDGSAPAVATARAGNVIGGGDWSADRLIPDLMRGALDGSAVRIRRPRAIRPWQHVLEPLAGYLLLAERLVAGEPGSAGPWNFGPAESDSWTVGEIVERLAALWGDDLPWQLDDADHPAEAGLLTLDSSKVRRLLGWRPRLDLPTALEWVVEWYRAAADGGDLTQLSAAQIARYEALA